MFIEILAVMAGGALGALARFGISIWTVQHLGSHFPLATFSVNILGSLIIGIAYVILVEKGMFNPNLKLFVTVGLLGAFTTFSSFSIETLLMMQRGDILTALIYVLASVLFCIGAAYIGLVSARAIV